MRDYREARLARITDEFGHGKYSDHPTSDVGNRVDDAFEKEKKKKKEQIWGWRR